MRSVLELARMKRVIRALAAAGKIEQTNALFAGWYALGVETGMGIAETKHEL